MLLSRVTTGARTGFASSVPHARTCALAKARTLARKAERQHDVVDHRAIGEEIKHLEEADATSLATTGRKARWTASELAPDLSRSLAMPKPHECG